MMTYNIHKLAVLGSGILLGSSLVFAAGEYGAGTQEDGHMKDQQQTQQQQNQQKVAVISFEKNQAKLTQEARQQLREQFQQIEDKDRIESLKVAVWSDQEFMPDSDLPKDAEQLAEQRANNISQFLSKDLKIDADVETYNMAKKAGALARTFNTEEAELKSIFAKRGGEKAQETPEVGSNSEIYIFRNQGAASKAVLVMTLKPHQQGQDVETQQPRP